MELFLFCFIEFSFKRNLMNCGGVLEFFVVIFLEMGRGEEEEEKMKDRKFKNLYLFLCLLYAWIGKM